MDRLHPDEFDFLMVLKYSKQQEYFFHIGSELRGQLEAVDWVGLLKRFEKMGLVTIRNIRINYSRGFLDAFLQPFSKAVTGNDFTTAMNLADIAGLPSLMKTVRIFETLNDAEEVLESVFNERSEITNLDPSDSEFGKDILEALEAEIVATKKLHVFYDDYIKAFTQDKLVERAKHESSQIGFDQPTKYRFKKQRQVFCDFLEQKLKTVPPDKIKILGFPREDLVRMDLDLLAEALVLDGTLADYHYTLSSKEPYHMQVSVHEDRIVNKKKTKLKLSFDTDRKLLTMVDELDNHYEERFQGAAQLDLLRIVLKNPIDFSKTWNTWEIAEETSREEKSITNAIYQINKRLSEIFPDMPHFIKKSGDYFSLNTEHIDQK